ncbi:hypothetical protein LTS07_009494 [Exophiala sideris]|uniref:Uncharacterized protein n=1 Tax=Exophiala sideris TaxID=1016849 RepID=A0ABR0J0K9_9EURO|nr:hypothetical protein LTS07_009494 [Exophiala sideris]KAK5053021.1 hypothetical protein LTR69_009591 [Exophiala sideris]
MSLPETAVDSPLGHGLADRSNHHTYESEIVTSLYQACWVQLSRLSNALASPNPRCQWLVTDIQSKLIIFGGSFDGGKLEFCLGADNELRHDVLLVLCEIGTILAYNVFRCATETLLTYKDDEITTRLSDALSSTKNILDNESSSDTSEDSSASEDSERTIDSRFSRALERQCLRPIAKNVDLLMSLYPTLEQLYRDKHQPPRAEFRQAIQDTSVTALSYVHDERDEVSVADKRHGKQPGEVNEQRHEHLSAPGLTDVSRQDLPKGVPKGVEMPHSSVSQPISRFRDLTLGGSMALKPLKAPSLVSKQRPIGEDIHDWASNLKSEDIEGTDQNDDSTLNVPDADTSQLTPVPWPRDHRSPVHRRRHDDVFMASSVISTRRPRDDEYAVMTYYSRHADKCNICADPYSAFKQDVLLCDRGYKYARDVAKYIYSKGGKPFSLLDKENGDRVQIQIPADCQIIYNLVKAFDHVDEAERIVTSSTEKRDQSVTMRAGEACTSAMKKRGDDDKGIMPLKVMPMKHHEKKDVTPANLT